LDDLDQTLPADLVANRLQMRKESPRIGEIEAFFIGGLRIILELVNRGGVLGGLN